MLRSIERSLQVWKSLDRKDTNGPEGRDRGANAMKDTNGPSIFYFDNKDTVDRVGSSCGSIGSKGNCGSCKESALVRKRMRYGSSREKCN
jgi:hypothetical protein